MINGLQLQVVEEVASGEDSKELVEFVTEATNIRILHKNICTPAAAGAHNCNRHLTWVTVNLIH